MWKLLRAWVHVHPPGVAGDLPRVTRVSAPRPGAPGSPASGLRHWATRLNQVGWSQQQLQVQGQAGSLGLRTQSVGRLAQGNGADRRPRGPPAPGHPALGCGKKLGGGGLLNPGDQGQSVT